MTRTPQFLTTAALCLAVALSAGCASTPKKPVAEQVPPESTSAPADADKTKAGTDDARTGGLDGAGGVNSQNLPDDGSGGDASAGGKGRYGGAGAGADANGGNGSDAAAIEKAALNDRVVNFDFDSSDIRQEDYATLLAHARYLQQNPQARVLLAGHADERGTREYNMALGERRAKAVEAFLGVNGVKSGQLDSVSYGKEKPLNDGHDEAAWAENRRVEIGYESGAPKD